MVDLDHVKYTVTSRRAEIVMNRPEILNAVSAQMIEELNVALGEATDDPSVDVIVLTGEGRGFCSGADISNMKEREDRNDLLTYRHHLEKLQSIVRRLHDGDKPSVAAVNGPSVGVGCDFALACDLRVMNEKSYLREQFVNIGLVPGDGGAWLLPRLIGESKAKEYLLTGSDITPEDAISHGLAAELAEDGSTLEVARALADKIAAKPRRAVQGTKALIDVNQSFEDHAHMAFKEQWQCIHDEEHHEAVAALQEGREPKFDRDS